MASLAHAQTNMWLVHVSITHAFIQRFMRFDVNGSVGPRGFQMILWRMTHIKSLFLNCYASFSCCKLRSSCAWSVHIVQISSGTVMQYVVGSSFGDDAPVVAQRRGLWYQILWRCVHMLAFNSIFFFELLYPSSVVPERFNFIGRWNVVVLTSPWVSIQRALGKPSILSDSHLLRFEARPPRRSV